MRKYLMIGVIVILYAHLANAQRYQRQKGNIGIIAGFARTSIYPAEKNASYAQQKNKWENSFSIGITTRINTFLYPEIHYVQQKTQIQLSDSNFVKPNFDATLHTVNIPMHYRTKLPLFPYKGKRNCKLLMLVPGIAPGFNVNKLQYVYNGSSSNNLNYNFSMNYTLGLMNYNYGKSQKNMRFDWLLEGYFTHLLGKIGEASIQQNNIPLKNRYFGLRLVCIYYLTYKSSNM